MNTLITHFHLRNAVPLLLVKGAAFRRGKTYMLLVSLPADSDDRSAWNKDRNNSGRGQDYFSEIPGEKRDPEEVL